MIFFKNIVQNTATDEGHDPWFWQLCFLSTTWLFENISFYILTVDIC